METVQRPRLNLCATEGAFALRSRPHARVHQLRNKASRCRKEQRRCRHTASISVQAASSEDTASGQIDAQTAAAQGQVSRELIERMKASIAEALEASSVEIADTYGDGRHVSIDVVSPQFEGKSSVKRQQAVYKAIWLELQDTVHAVDAMTTKTPAEASA